MHDLPKINVEGGSTKKKPLDNVTYLRIPNTNVEHQHISRLDCSPSATGRRCTNRSSKSEKYLYNCIRHTWFCCPVPSWVSVCWNKTSKQHSESGSLNHWSKQMIHYSPATKEMSWTRTSPWATESLKAKGQRRRAAPRSPLQTSLFHQTPSPNDEFSKTMQAKHRVEAPWLQPDIHWKP